MPTLITPEFFSDPPTEAEIVDDDRYIATAMLDILRDPRMSFTVENVRRFATHEILGAGAKMLLKKCF